MWHLTLSITRVPPTYHNGVLNSPYDLPQEWGNLFSQRVLCQVGVEESV